MKVAVVGGGIGGLIAALGFRRHGFAVEVFERLAAPLGGGIQLSPNAMKVLRRLDCADPLQQVASEPAAGVLRHWRSGKVLLSTPLRDFCRQRYGERYLHVHRADLLGVLERQAEQVGVVLHRATEVIDYRQSAESIHLRCRDGSEVEAGLLIGADGIDSAVRAAMLGAEAPRFTGQVGWRGLVQTVQVPQQLRPEHWAHIWLGPGRHFVAYYLGPERDRINFVAVEERQDWSGEDSAPQPDSVENPQRAFAGWHPAVGAILAGAEDCRLWGLFDRPPLPRWSDGRAVLLGDACHPMLPFQAQGGAMAIEDGYVLAESCRDLTEGADLSLLRSALLAYEQKRRPRTTWMQQISRRNAALFHARSFGARLRRQLLFVLARVAPSNPRLDRIYGLDVTK